MDIISVSGSVKSLEKSFLTSDAVKKLIQAKNFGEFADMLGSTFYKLSSNIKKIDEIIRVFEDSRIEMIEEMSRNLPASLYNYFILRYDYHNLGVLVSPGGENKEKSYSPYASVDFRILDEALETNNYKNIPLFLKGPLSLAAGYKNEKVNIAEISLALKKSYYDVAKYLLRTQKSPMIDYYLGIDVDFANIAILLQGKTLGINTDKNLLIENGNIKRERVLNEDVLWATVNKEYRGAATPVTTDIYDSERYRALMGHIKTGRVFSYGIEPVFCYFAARELEMENIRRLAIGKFYNLKAETLSDWGAYAYQYA